jgi:mannitol-1-phosphate 5-dehydrogenase
MRKKAILIGAGQIGRGFIGEALSKSGYSLTFIDISSELVEKINKYQKYKVITLGAEEEEYVVENIKAYTPDDEAAVNEIIQADIITTAVGPSVLHKTADYIVKGIRKRYENKIDKPLTIIACENMEFATSSLFGKFRELLTKQELSYCQQYVGFPDAEVSRMVIPVEETAPLTVKVEKYMEWIVDKKPLKADLSHIIGLQLTDNPTAFIKRKIYTLTGHAMAGFLGYAKGYEYIYQAVYDDGIFKAVFKALTECGKAWSKEYKMPEEEFNEYITLMMRRFSDTRLKDPLTRVCKEPKRKLAKGERFIGPALTAIQHGIMPVGIIEGIKAALKYDYSEDKQAVELQSLLNSDGIDAVLTNICGLTRDSVLYEMLTT